MHALFTIIHAGTVFMLVAVLGIMQRMIGLRAITQLRVRLLCNLVPLGMGIDDEAIERLRRIPDAEAILEAMAAADAPSRSENWSYKFDPHAQHSCSTPAMVLEMLRGR